MHMFLCSLHGVRWVKFDQIRTVLNHFKEVMAYCILAPGDLSFQGNPAENWKKWLEKFTLFPQGNEKDGKSDKVNIGILQSHIGDEARERYNFFEWTEAEDKTKYEHVVAKWTEQLAGMKRLVFSRYQFWSFQRGESQPFAEYLINLETLAAACKFQELHNMICDKIVFDTKNHQLLQRLLREKDLTLQNTIDMCTLAQESHKQAKEMRVPPVASAGTSAEKEVHALRTRLWQNPP